MANSTAISTLLPLNTWAQLMGINLFEFNQIGEGFPQANSAQCPHVWYQYQWQQNFLSRDEIGEAVSKAEAMISEELNYWPAPKAITETTLYPRPANRTTFGAGGTIRGQHKAVRLKWGHVQNVGVLKRTLISAAVAVTLVDKDGDTVKESFTMTFATSVTDPGEIAAYFDTVDRNNDDVSELFRLRPIKVSISGGNCTVTGHASLLVLPNLETITNPVSLDVTGAIYATALDVYRLYISGDTTLSEQGQAIWDDPNCSSTPCNVQVGPICMTPQIAEQGIVTVDYRLNNCPPVAYEPDRLLLNYLAGYPLNNYQVDPIMADIIAHLATALLPVGNCACDRADRIVAYWRDVAPAAGEGLQQTQNMRGNFSLNPFGPQRGAVWAYQRVRTLINIPTTTL